MVKKKAIAETPVITEAKPVPVPVPPKPLAERGVEDWISVGLQSCVTAEGKKFVREAGLRKWLAEHYAGAQGQNAQNFLTRALQKELVKMLGNGFLLQNAGKWRVSLKGRQKYGDISVVKTI